MVYNNTKIVSCTINVTERCNLSCKYCFAWGKGKDDLSFDIGKEMIDFFFKWADPSADHYEISFWGGEPLLRFDLIKRLVEYASKKSSKVIFGGTTNGLLLDKEKLEFLRDCKGKMMVSIDGDKDIHDKYRIFPNGSGSWNLTLEKVKEALEYWPDLKIRFSLSPELVPKLYDSCLFFFEEIGVRWIAFSPVVELQWTKKDFKILRKQLVKLVKYLQKNRDKFIHHLSNPGEGIWQDFPCGAGRTYIHFAIDGSIYPCHRFNKLGEGMEEHNKKVVIGHIKEGFYPLRQIFLDYPVIRKNQCFQGIGCSVYNACAGGCYAVTYDLTGNVFGHVHHLCEYTRVFFEVAGESITNRSCGLGGRSCICYNACFLEGTPSEIQDIDPNANFSCMCYATSYTGDLNSQWRPFKR